MKMKVNIAIVLAAAFLCSCGSDDSLDPVNDRSPEDTVLFGVGFSSSAKSTRAPEDDTTPVYFITGTDFKDQTTRMRINYGINQNFDFTMDYKEYVYDKTLEVNGEYGGNKYNRGQYNFAPYNNSVLKWSEVITLGTNFAFTCAIFPRTYESFTNRFGVKKVDTDQTTLYKLLANDLLVAYHIHSDITKDIVLTFYHAMAMLVCKVYIPIYTEGDESGQGFNEQPAAAYTRKDLLTEAEKEPIPGGFKEALLLDRITNFLESGTTPDNVRIFAQAVQDSVPKNLQMCLISIDEPVSIPDEDLPEEDKGKEYEKQCYTYAVLVPEPADPVIKEKMLRFVITDPFGHDRIYTYTPTNETKDVKLSGSSCLLLELEIKRNSDKPVKVSAEVKPWGYVDVDVPVFPVDDSPTE